MTHLCHIYNCQLAQDLIWLLIIQSFFTCTSLTQVQVILSFHPSFIKSLVLIFYHILFFDYSSFKKSFNLCFYFKSIIVCIPLVF